MTITDRFNPEIHVRFEGRSYRLTADSLGINPTSEDAEVRAGLARYLEVPFARVTTLVVERHSNGNLTVRPEAVFG